MIFQVLKYDHIYREQWNTFIKKSKNGLFFFDRDFMDYHQDRIKDHSLIFFKGNEIVSVFPASTKDQVIISHGGLTFGSLIISNSTKASEVVEIFRLLKAYYSSQGFAKLIYKAIPYIFCKNLSQEDLYSLFVLDAKIIRRDISSVIDLSNKIEFSQSKKNLVNRFLKANTAINEESSFSEFWDLLTKVLQKFESKPVHTLQEIELLKSRFPENIKLFTLREDGAILAGLVIFDFGAVVHTQYMANSDKGRKIGALDFINYQLINTVYQNKKYYSFGISTENSGRYLNEGLIQQKELMGGRAVTLDFYEIDLNEGK